MLTLDDFNALTENEKADAVWSGSFLADREEGSFKVQLYRLDSLYVEVFYEPLKNKIIRFHAFTNKASLVPYLKHLTFKPA